MLMRKMLLALLTVTLSTGTAPLAVRTLLMIMLQVKLQTLLFPLRIQAELKLKTLKLLPKRKRAIPVIHIVSVAAKSLKAEAL